MFQKIEDKILHENTLANVHARIRFRLLILNFSFKCFFFISFLRLCRMPSTIQVASQLRWREKKENPRQFPSQRRHHLFYLLFFRSFTCHLSLLTAPQARPPVYTVCECPKIFLRPRSACSCSCSWSCSCA